MLDIHDADAWSGTGIRQIIAWLEFGKTLGLDWINVNENYIDPHATTWDYGSNFASTFGRCRLIHPDTRIDMLPAGDPCNTHTWECELLRLVAPHAGLGPGRGLEDVLRLFPKQWGNKWGGEIFDGSRAWGLAGRNASAPLTVDRVIAHLQGFAKRVDAHRGKDRSFGLRATA